MRFLLLLVLIGAAAYFSVPTREAHEEAARALLEAQTEEQTQGIEAQLPGMSLDGVVDFFTGMVAGQGRYETFYVASKFTADLPGSAYIECWGAFTQVRCSEAGGAAQQ